MKKSKIIKENKVRLDLSPSTIQQAMLPGNRAKSFSIKEGRVAQGHTVQRILLRHKDGHPQTGSNDGGGVSMKGCLQLKSTQ